MNFPKGFSSDNSSGAHPKIIQAIIDANQGHTPSYGNDPITERLSQEFKKHFGSHVESFPVLSGTGANVLAIASATKSFHAIFCAHNSHMYVDETGAPEKFSGAKLIPIPAKSGKITKEQIEPYLYYQGDMHRSQPSLISITQATELGTLYQPGEIRKLAEFAHKHQMHLHMDGARISNAAVALNISFKELVTDTGVDILSFGGTKNGLLFGDAVVFLNPGLAFEHAKDFKYLRKHGLQLASKMRYISAQLVSLLSGDLWKENAAHSNAMAARLARGLKEISKIEITQPVETNAVFAKLPLAAVAPLQKEFPFYVWDGATHEGIPEVSLEVRPEVRWMTSFDTTPEEVDRFLELLKRI